MRYANRVTHVAFTPRKATMRLALLCALLLALLAPTAAAQDAEGHLSQSAEQTACGEATVTFTVSDDGFAAYTWSYFSGPNAGGDAAFEGQVTVEPGDTGTAVVAFDEDAHDGSAFVSYGTIAGPEQAEYLPSEAIGVQTDCEEAPQPEPGDECTTGTGARGTINEDGECVEDRDVFTTCIQAWAALDDGTLLPEQFPIRLAIEGETVICELPEETTPPTTTEPPAETATPDPEPTETDLGIIPATTVPPTATATPVEELAYTGVSLGWALAAGAALLTGGGGALLLARRWGVR